MKRTLILKVTFVVLLILIAVIAIIVAYFFNADIETKEPEYIIDECEINTYEYNERKVFVIRNNEKQEHKYILYFHGGSYIAEATENHWNFLEKLVKDVGYTVIMPDYPLAPKYNYKDVYNMVEPLYKEIVEKVGNNNLILMGDSAGGGLALGLYEKVTNDGMEAPIKTILISPWLDVRLENEKIKEIEKNDNILNKEALRLAGIAYSGEDGINSYLVNPIDGNLSILKNIKIFVGTYDILNPDCNLLKEKADNVSGDVEIKQYERAKHIWLIDNNSEEEVTQKAYEDLVSEIVN